MNGSAKRLMALVAVLAVSACNAGESSNVPITSGHTTPAAARSAMPRWQAMGLAKPACPQVTRRPTCLALIESKSGIDPSVAGWAPSDFQARYDLPSSTGGKGQIVAIVDAYDNPNVASDLAAYRSHFGLGTASFTKYNQRGQTKKYPGGSTGWGLEIDLDVQMVSAICPLCTIDLVEADSSDSADLQTAEAEAVALGAHVVSNSWVCYGSYTCVDPSYFDKPGVLYTAGTGDVGYGFSGAPAALPSVVSVGGTVLAKSRSTYDEIVWDGTGAACATDVAKPAWQHDPDCTSRTEGDVSAVAWQVAEYDTYGYHGWFTVGGTSIATPMIAAVYALAGNAAKQVAAKKIWLLKKQERNAALHDISSGSDGSCGGSYLCQAGTNQFHTYSGPAGWGTPNGTQAF